MNTVEQNILIVGLLIPMPCSEHDDNANLLLWTSFQLKRKALLLCNRHLNIFHKTMMKDILRYATPNCGHHIQFWLESALANLGGNVEVLRNKYKWEKGIAP